MPAPLPEDAQDVLGCFDDAMKSCAWDSWVVDTEESSKKHRKPITAEQALKMKEHLDTNKRLEEIFTLQKQNGCIAFAELCSYETSEQTELRIKNANVTTAPFDTFGSLLDMLRLLAEFTEVGSRPRPEELKRIHSYLGTMTACLAKALIDVWAGAAIGNEAQKEKERKISVILQHLTCHGALGWTDGNMPFVFTCVHPAQSHYTAVAARKIMNAVDRKQLSKLLVKLSTIGVIYDGREGSEVPYILEFSSFLLRQLIVTLSIPKDLMQSYREILRFMIDLVRDQQSGAEFEHKSNILYPIIRGIIFHYPRDTRNSRGGESHSFSLAHCLDLIPLALHQVLMMCSGPRG